MFKMSTKLIAVTLALILSVSMVVMSSYAWLVLAGNPAVTGIQVAIGGGNTILIAPDLTEEKDGITYHYPGVFSDKLNFSQHESYSYLAQLGGLTPVSTVDGVNWFLPAYYDRTDAEVQKGNVPVGQLKEIKDFIQDVDLEHANLSASDVNSIREGNYIFLDFWVVAPGADYTLRVSTGDDSGGSFLVDLLQPGISSNGATGYSLVFPENEAAAAVRVGFLTNPHRISDNTMLLYQNSIAFNERFTSLQGIIQDPDSGTANLQENRFTIYEPNADLHPSGIAADGSYVVTSPVGLVNGVPQAVSAVDRLTVQKTTLWAKAESGDGVAIEQRFQTAAMGMDLSGMKLSEISEAFYGTYLQGQLSPYLEKGDFIKRTTELYASGSVLSAEQLAALESAGATDDVYIIELTRNVPQRIRMFIWLEGQDVDCVNSVSTSSFAVSIELAGSTE